MGICLAGVSKEEAQAAGVSLVEKTKETYGLETDERRIYASVFAYEFPIFGGVLAPHTGGDLPFLFNNLDKIPQMVNGDEETAQNLADCVSTALGNFARTGDPSQDGLEWPAYTNEEGAAMIFDAQSEVRYHHDAELVPIIEEEELPFDPQQQGGF